LLEKYKKNDFSGVLIVISSSIFFAMVPSSAKIALDNGVSLLVLLFSRCLIGLILLTPLIFLKNQKQ
jgi:drug/metabolite transporter (DMT)-like permease